MTKIFQIIILLSIGIEGLSQDKFDSDLQNLIDITTYSDVILDLNDLLPPYTVHGKWTMGVAWPNDTIDNIEHKLFRVIVDNYSKAELVIMANHDFSNNRVYGYWGLLIKQAKEEARTVYRSFKSDSSEFIYIGFSDVLADYTVSQFAKELRKGKLRY